MPYIQIVIKSGSKNMLLAIHVIDPKENEFYTISVGTSLKDLYQYDVCMFQVLIGKDHRYLNLKKLPNLTELDIPFYEWMADRTYDGYDTVADPELVTTKTVKQQNLSTAMHLLIPTNASGSIEDKRPIELFDDIAMRLPDIAQEVANNALFSVNGYIHRQLSNTDYLYLLGANRSYLKGGMLDLDVLDFTNLGGIVLTDVTSDNVSNISDGTCYYRLSKKVTDGITPFIVILGQLFILTENSQSIKLVADDFIEIDIDNIGERILRAIADGIIKPEDVGLTVGDNDIYSVKELLSDDTFKRVIDLPHTFTGYINRQTVYVRKRKLENMANTNIAFIGTKLNNPILNATGQIIKHIYRKEDNANTIAYSTTCLLEDYRLSDSRWKLQQTVKMVKKPVDRIDTEHLYEYLIHGE